MKHNDELGYTTVTFITFASLPQESPIDCVVNQHIAKYTDEMPIDRHLLSANHCLRLAITTTASATMND